MKDLKDIILDRRIRNLEIEGKQVPDKYISVFNSYLEQIAESLTDYTKQVRKEVYDYILDRLGNIEIENNTDYNSFIAILDEILDQIKGD